MTRRQLLRRAALLGAALPLTAHPGGPALLVEPSEFDTLQPSPALKTAREACIAKGPWSVTYSRPNKLSEAGLHDFFSEGPYWWPDPRNPNGPYIRKDGKVNHERFTDNDLHLGLMSNAVLTLALSAALNKDEEAAARAWRLLDIWFLQPDTYMNPNLEFGQAIRGITTGRGIGIIDTRPLIWCAQGIALLERCNPNPKLSEGLRRWFSDYVQWLTVSTKGLEERDNGNNHSTWWATQVAAYSIYCGDEKSELAAYDLCRTRLIPNQLRPDGSAPAEEARTRSLSYSIMNLDGFTLLCRLAKRRGMDLWNFKTPDGAGVLTSVEYLAPYVAAPSTWKKTQILPFTRNHSYFLGLAGIAANRRAWVDLQLRTGNPGGAWGLLFDMLLKQWLARA
ncbi:alginate lyase family protein [uncultured Paludibaculum sp.]|uniref:alginate lyase family protein n=1 Tax=uncultured Paludibaculum sp. TaxID=1765020 RepID=UPI002AAC066C|nr:alginate lyase family protein [uncultured Paludibaculum sp.]